MKKTFLLIASGLTCLSGFAQDSLKHTLKNFDQVLPRFFIDVDYMPGLISSQNISMVNMANGYSTMVPNSTAPVIGNRISSATFTKGNTFGSTQGGDIQFGAFFGKGRHFGLGTGIIYLHQTGNVSLDNFHVEYQNATATDNNGVFRQILTGYNVNEDINITNLTIPVLAKYKHQFSKNFGVNVEAGALINVNTQTGYTTHAAFDYEEARLTSSDGRSQFDNTASGYNPADWLITKAQYAGAYPASNGVNAYFQGLHNQGYNVADSFGIKSKGNTAYSKVSFGGMAKVALTYQFSYHLTGVVGAYVMYQDFKNSGNNNYTITNQVGEYHSIVAGQQSNGMMTMGATIGFRYFFGEKRDVDGDDVIDANDSCKLLFGDKIYFGCPDSDHDGIPDNQDQCPLQFGTALAFGCPDRDNDGIRDDVDQCPDEAGPECTRGCPDRDGDCVEDALDDCPDLSGPRSNKGCPIGMSTEHRDTVIIQPVDSNGILMSKHLVLSSSTINFNSGQALVDKANDKLLDDAVDVLNKNPKVIIYISGYTDNVGDYMGNLMLSIKRAGSVNSYFLSKGITKDRIIVSGYGEEKPIGDNRTPEERRKNRRIEMKLLLPLDK